MTTTEYSSTILDEDLIIDTEEMEYEDMIDAAMRESDETGISFDHIMGEYLGGMRDNY